MITNWYWPQGDGSFKYKILALALNWLSNRIGFKRTNADLHDKSYGKGWSEYDRIEADCWLYERLLKDALDSKSPRFAISCAHIYFKFIRWFGASSFNYTKDKW